MHTKLTAIFSIVVGISMIGVWAMLVGTGNVSEFETEPMRIGLHIFSELATALLLIISGIGIIAKKGWSKKLLFLSLGALFYSLINAIGFCGQSGDFIMIIVFVVIFIIATVLSWIWFKKEKNSDI